MATDKIEVDMRTLQQVVYDDKDCNGLIIDGCGWRKPYSARIPANITGVQSITITRSESESNCGQMPTPSTLSSSGTVLYGDTVTVTATPKTGYEITTQPTFKTGVTNGKVTGAIELNAPVAERTQYKISFGNLTYGTWRINSASSYTGYVPYGSTWSIANYLSTDLRNQMILTMKDPDGNTLFTADYVRPVSDTATIQLYYNTAANGLDGTFDSYLNGSLITDSTLWTLWKYNYRFAIDESSSSGTITEAKTFSATVTRESASLSYAIQGTNGASSTTGYRTLKVSGYCKDIRASDADNMIGLMEQYIYTEDHSAACYFEFDNSTLPTTLTANYDLTPVVKQYMRMKTVTLAVSPAGYGTTVYGTSNITWLSVPYGTKVSSDTSRVAFVVDSTTYPNAVNNKINGSTEAIVTSDPKDADGSYTYASNGWTNGSGTITANTTITANFTRTPYRVITIENGSWGTVKYGSTPLSNGDTVPNGVTLTIAIISATGFDTTVGSSTGTISSSTGGTMGVNGDETITFNRTRLSYTVSFTNPTYGTWANASLSMPYQTTWSVSGNTVTFTKPDNGGTVTNIVTATSPTARTLSFAADANSRGSWNSTSAVSVYDYSYTTPTIGGNATGTVTDKVTFTSSNSRSNVTFTNSLSTVPTNASTSGNHVWTIKGKTTAGADFTRTFTSTAHTTQYYYVISRSSSATQATSNITFTPTVAMNVHTYTITINNASWGTVKNGSTTIASGAVVSYGTKLTITPNTTTDQYNFTASSSTGTITGNQLEVNGNEVITFNRSVRNYTATFTKPTYGSWTSATLSLPYGTTWSFGTDTITFTKPDNTTITNKVTANSPTVRTLKFGTANYGSWNSTTNVSVYDYKYSTPQIDANSGSNKTGTIVGAKTFTAAITRSNVTFVNTLEGTTGTNSTYSGTQTWKIGGTDINGVGFTKTFTTNANDAEFYYNIARSSTATQATSDITFTPSVTRSTHSYVITIQNTSWGTVMNGSSLVSNGASINYGTVLTVDPIDSSAQYQYKATSPSGTHYGTHSFTVTSASTVTFAREVRNYKVKFVPNTVGWGTLSHSELTVPYGTTLTQNSNTIMVGNTTVTATATTATAQYLYGFSSWQDPGTNTVQGDMTITANFSRTLRTYTVTISRNNTGYGTVSSSSVTGVAYGTAISASGSTLTIGSTNVTATPTTDTAQYDYSFSSWSGVPSGGTITGATTVTANFSRAVKQYTISITNAGYGTVKKSDGTSLVSGATVAYGTVLTLTPTTNTAQYSYSVASSTGTIYTEGNLKKLLVDGAETITFSRTVNKYAITITNSSYGTVKNGSTTLSSGATVNYGTVLTITPNTDTAQYDYSVSSSTGTINSSNQLTVDGAETITFSRTTRKYTLTITNPSYGTVKNASGTALSNGATVTYGDVLTVVPKSSTAQYTYGADTSTGSFVIVSGNRTLTVNGNETIIFSRTTNTYTVTVVPSNSNYGSVNPTSVTNVPYGTTLSLSGSYAYVGDTKLTATPKTATAQYEYQHTGWAGASGTVTGNTTITANFRVVTRSYTISYPAMPTGVSSFKIYKAGTAVVTNPTAAGSFTATYGDYVYATATATTGYNSPTISGISTNSGSPTQVTGATTVTLTAGSRKTYTVSFTNPTYGSWNSSSLTLPYGTTWEISSGATGSTITFTKPDGAGTVTNKALKKLATVQTLSFATASYGSWNDTSVVKVLDYTYTVPAISGNTTGTITSATTFTASDSRSKVTFTNSLSGTSGTNSTYSGTHKWTISGTDQSGTAFSRVFTSTAHSARYYYVVSRSSTATSATSNITFTPTVTRSVHGYTLTKSTITGVASHTVGRTSSPDGGAGTSYSLANGETIYYNDVLTISAVAAGGYNNPTVTSPVTVTGNVATKDYITAGSAITSLSAPVLGTITDGNDEYGDYLFVQITNNNSVSVTAHVTWKDLAGSVAEADTIHIGANTSETYWNEYYAPDYCTVEVYFTSGSATSDTTTATYGAPSYLVKLPALPRGVTEIEYEVEYEGSVESYYAQTNTRTIKVKHGAGITPYVACATGIALAEGYGDWIITAATTIPAPSLKFNITPELVSSSVTNTYAYFTYKNTSGINAKIVLYGSSSTAQDSVLTEVNKSGQIISSLLSPNTTYTFGICLEDYNNEIAQGPMDYQTVTTKPTHT